MTRRPMAEKGDAARTRPGVSGLASPLRQPPAIMIADRDGDSLSLARRAQSPVPLTSSSPEELRRWTADASIGQIQNAKPLVRASALDRPFGAVAPRTHMRSSWRSCSNISRHTTVQGRPR